MWPFSSCFTRTGPLVQLLRLIARGEAVGLSLATSNAASLRLFKDTLEELDLSETHPNIHCGLGGKGEKDPSLLAVAFDDPWGLQLGI